MSVCVWLFVCLAVCVFAFFSAISKPTGTPFGTKLPLGPGMVLKQQYLGKRKKCGNAARDTSFLAVLVKYLGHFETDLDAFWHEITFWSCEGCKTSIFGKTQKMWQRCTENVILNRFLPGKRPNYWTDSDTLLHTNYILVSDVTRRIFFQKSQKMSNLNTHMHISDINT